MTNPNDMNEDLKVTGIKELYNALDISNSGFEPGLIHESDKPDTIVVCCYKYDSNHDLVFDTCFSFNDWMIVHAITQTINEQMTLFMMKNKIDIEKVKNLKPQELKPEAKLNDKSATRKRRRKNRKRCKVIDCENFASSRAGYCGKHYRRFKDYGDPLLTKMQVGNTYVMARENAKTGKCKPVKNVEPVEMSICKVGYCDKTTASLNVSYCSKHQKRFKKYGDPYITQKSSGGFPSENILGREDPITGIWKSIDNKELKLDLKPTKQKNGKDLSGYTVKITAEILEVDIQNIYQDIYDGKLKAHQKRSGKWVVDRAAVLERLIDTI